MVIGKMQARKYEKDGVEREAWELKAESMQMLGGRSEGGGQQSGGGDSAPAPQAQRQPRPTTAPRQSFDDLDDSIPFAPLHLPLPT